MISLQNSVCSACDLSKSGNINCLRGRGPAKAQMMFVGEAPSEDDDIRNEPFSGSVGEVLDRLLISAGIPRQAVYLTHVVKCRPIDRTTFRRDYKGGIHYPNLTPTPAQSYACGSTHLEREISDRGPAVVVSMGNVASEYLLGKYELLEGGGLRMGAKGDKPAIVRRLPKITDLIYGDYWDERRKVRVVPMLHPSFVMRSQESFLMMVELIRKAEEIARLGPGTEVTQSFVATNFDDAMAVVQRALEQRRLAYDHETDGLDWRFGQLINTGFSWREGTGATIRWIDEKGVSLYTPDQIRQLREGLRGVFCSPDKELITYNGPFDDAWSWAHLGFKPTAPQHDVQLVYHTLNSAATYRQQSLESLSWLYTRMCDYKAESKPWFDKKDFVGCPVDVMSRRNCADADATLRLVNRFLPKLQAGPTAAHYEATIRHMSRQAVVLNHNGASVSLERLRQMRDRLKEASAELASQFCRAMDAPEHAPGQEGKKKPKPFNIGSSKQLGWLLFEKHKLPVLERTPTGNPATSEYVLSELAKQKPEMAPLMEHKKLQKLLGTYVLGLRGCALFGNSRKRTPDIWTVEEARRLGFDTDGRVHPSFNIVGTVTGRPSVTSPNVANQPRPTPQQRSLGVVLRQAFAVEKGWWIVERDYSQAELRVLAAVSGDKALEEAVNSKEGVHKRTAAKFYFVPVEQVTDEQKAPSKTVVFAIVYGGTEMTVEEQIPEVLDAELKRRMRNKLAITRLSEKELDAKLAEYVPSKEERLALAKEWIDSWRAQYPKAGAWIDSVKAFVRKHGYVTSVFGRVYHFPLAFSSNPAVYSACERAAVNYLIQGPAVEVTAAASIRIQAEIDRRGLKSRWVNFVYDALSYEVPDDELELMKELMRVEMERPVPGLPINFRTDLEVGHCWKEDKEDKVPLPPEPDEEQDFEEEEE